jgi:hypothetical protein
MSFSTYGADGSHFCETIQTKYIRRKIRRLLLKSKCPFGSTVNIPREQYDVNCMLSRVLSLLLSVSSFCHTNDVLLLKNFTPSPRLNFLSFVMDPLIRIHQVVVMMMWCGSQKATIVDAFIVVQLVYHP